MSQPSRGLVSVISLTPNQKRGRPEGRPKSREETPKEGCNIGTQRSMLRCTICCIVGRNAGCPDPSGPNRCVSPLRSKPMDGVDEPCSPTPPTGHQHQSGHLMCYEGRTSSRALDRLLLNGFNVAQPRHAG